MIFVGQVDHRVLHILIKQYGKNESTRKRNYFILPYSGWSTPYTRYGLPQRNIFRQFYSFNIQFNKKEVSI